MSMFNNTFWDTNSDYVKDVTNWTFKQRGVLRFGNVTHYDTRNGVKEDGYLESQYTINDTVHYHIDIEEWAEGAWRPFRSDKVYLEFVMLDPYIRKYLTHDGKGRYSANFQVPDVYGVFTFKARFNAIGYYWLDEKTRVPVRPYRHDEYERFLTAAMPYYASVVASIAGFLWFSYKFLTHKD
jgi:oligosaccharyltransferase complex subunit beta